jgi:hypothetical protein
MTMSRKCKNSANRPTYLKARRGEQSNGHRPHIRQLRSSPHNMAPDKDRRDLRERPHHRRHSMIRVQASAIS